jgi:probable F420-dependent oxidoreductase
MTQTQGRPRLGVVLPPEEIGTGPDVIRDYVQGAETLGYQYVDLLDHVLGADPTNRPGWTGPYTNKDVFQEPLVTHGFVAGVTKTIELFTGVLVLPQRQTALVAKQTAALDVLSGGRFRFGVGIGWNDVEYEALGADFRTRGRRMDEQIAVLRELWTKEVVTFHGEWHHIQEAGINPLPVQRPIPIWVGGSSDAALRRAARLADGWVPTYFTVEQGGTLVSKIRAYMQEAGRDPAKLQFEGRLRVAGASEAEWGAMYRGWRDMGATHFLVDTRRGGLDSPEAHLKVLRRFKEILPTF